MYFKEFGLGLQLPLISKTQKKLNDHLAMDGFGYLHGLLYFLLNRDLQDFRFPRIFRR